LGKTNPSEDWLLKKKGIPEYVRILARERKKSALQPFNSCGEEEKGRTARKAEAPE